MDAMTFLQSTAKPQAVYVISGEEDFLRKQCRESIIKAILGDVDPEFAVSTFPGDKLEYSALRNELDTLSFFSPLRVVVVEQAEDFISEHRGQLEQYVQNPSKTGVLVLEPKSFPETTRLAKALSDQSKIACKAPAEYKLAEWCQKWAKTVHRRAMSADAAGLFVDQVGTSLGLLGQELAKLHSVLPADQEITPECVAQLVPRSREANVFDILDAIADGKPNIAFHVLHETLAQGGEPIAVLGALTFQLRRLSQVGRFLAQGQALGPALDAAGIPNWPKVRISTEKLARHLGLRRLGKITDWLVDINLGLKGGNSLPPKVQLEVLLTRLARPRE